ncbi:hypothetical protein [Methylomonas albis]|nr:hypothetical protein [Methylomonas albis]CAD6880101.1 hypothetical protein [Methylomonas albis]
MNNHAYTVTVIAFGGLGRPRHLGFDPTRGSKPWLSHDSTPYRDALQFF